MTPPEDATASGSIGGEGSGGIGATGGAGAALSRELADFLIELSIALHKHAMYPPEHPSLMPAAQSVANHLDELLESRSVLSLGVARNQLVIEGVATESKNPVLSDLARRLHRHHLGAISFNRGVMAWEVQAFLKLVAEDADRSGEPLGLAPSETRHQQPNIGMYPVAYDQLHLLGGEQDEEEREEQAEARTHFAQLWVGLARAAIGSTDNDREVEHEPSVVASAISQQTRNAAYDQVIVGYLLQIAEELKGAGGSDAVALKNRMNKLVGALDEQTLERLLAMGGSAGQRRQFLLDASQGMAVDSVLKLVEAASNTESNTVSDYMLRMLQKMGHHAESTVDRRREMAETSMRDQISELIQGWSLTDPNPDGYSAALQGMATSAPLFQVSQVEAYLAEPKRIVETALEVGVSGRTVVNAMQAIVDSDEADWLVNTLQDAEEESADLLWSEFAEKEQLERILYRDKLEPEVLDRIVNTIGVKAVDPMLDCLANSDSQQTRRLLLDRLVQMGTDLAPKVIEKLDDERWYVQRNMLTILGELPTLPSDFNPGDFAHHTDARVRREALRVMVRVPTTRERGICQGLADADERTQRMALSAVGDECPKAAVPLVVSRAASGLSEDVRLAAIRVLGGVRDGAAIEALLTLARPRRRSLFGGKQATKPPEYLAALTSLARLTDDPRARQVIDEARASGDPDVVAAASGRKRPSRT